MLTDFGTGGPYLGEMRSVLEGHAPGHGVVDLMHDLPAFEPRLAAYVVARLVCRQDPGSVFVCVVDPGVGTRERRAVWLEAGGRVLVGPDNGLLQVAACEASRARWFEILWRPRALSVSFHGRDLFAPAAARLATGEMLAARPLRRRSRFSARWPEDLPQVVYVDGYGNLMTGFRSRRVSRRQVLEIAGVSCRFARTFGDAPADMPFWYGNSMGLVEVAWPRGSAARELGAGLGEAVTWR